MNKKAIISIIMLSLTLSISASEEVGRAIQMLVDLKNQQAADFAGLMKDLTTSSHNRHVFRRSNQSIVEVPLEEYNRMCKMKAAIEQSFKPKPMSIVLASFDKDHPVKLQVHMPAYYYQNSSDLQGIEELRERREIALLEKLIDDEIDCEHVIVTEGEAYGFKKVDKEFFLVHPRLHRESTHAWLKRLVEIRFLDENSASSSHTQGVSSEEIEQRRFFEEPLVIIDYPPLKKVDGPVSEEMVPNAQILGDDSEVDPNMHDNLPVPYRESIVKGSAQEQLIGFKEKFNEDSSMFSTKAKVALGVTAAAAYAYFCYSKSQIVRTKK